MSHHGNPEEQSEIMKEFRKASHRNAMPKLDDKAKEIIGATGRFPHGKISKDDEGEIAMAVGSDPSRGVVFIDFGESVQWFGMTAKEVDGLCELLQQHRATL